MNIQRRRRKRHDEGICTRAAYGGDLVPRATRLPVPNVRYCKTGRTWRHRRRYACHGGVGRRRKNMAMQCRRRGVVWHRRFCILCALPPTCCMLRLQPPTSHLPNVPITLTYHYWVDAVPCEPAEGVACGGVAGRRAPAIKRRWRMNRPSDGGRLPRTPGGTFGASHARGGGGGVRRSWRLAARRGYAYSCRYNSRSIPRHAGAMPYACGALALC